MKCQYILFQYQVASARRLQLGHKWVFQQNIDLEICPNQHKDGFETQNHSFCNECLSFWKCELKRENHMHKTTNFTWRRAQEPSTFIHLCKNVHICSKYISLHVLLNACLHFGLFSCQ